MITNITEAEIAELRVLVKQWVAEDAAEILASKKAKTKKPKKKAKK